MSGVFKRQRTSSTASGTLPVAEDEAFPADSEPRNGSSEIGYNRPQSKAGGRTASSTSVAGLSSSYSLPSRSYIHHAGHESREPLQYSSSGVREQTAELSSSLFGESEMSKHFSPDKSSSRTGSGRTRQHEPIEEISEPGTPTGSDGGAPASSELTSAHRKQRPRDIAQTAKSSRETPPAPSIPQVVVTDEDQPDVTETTPLLPRERLSSDRKPSAMSDEENAIDGQDEGRPGIWNRFGHQYPSIRNLRRPAFNPKAWNFKHVAHKTIIEPATMLPAVFLGLLLNLLDALSYGIILFPLGEEPFAALGPDGVSMFYVSCIVAQLTYSTGSIFRGGVGSEMIEVVPFFHKMTYLIMNTMGTGNPEALRATVITSYAMSSVVTGIVFFALGSARLGTLVNFFPHSILTGCIGGVGIFLFLTGVEVSARLDGNLEFTVDVACYS